jgi:hypothetical protein
MVVSLGCGRSAEGELELISPMCGADQTSLQFICLLTGQVYGQKVVFIGAKKLNFHTSIAIFWIPFVHNKHLQIFVFGVQRNLGLSRFSQLLNARFHLVVSRGLCLAAGVCVTNRAVRDG